MLFYRLLQRGSMFVFSESQIERLLNIDSMWKADRLLDLGLSTHLLSNVCLKAEVLPQVVAEAALLLPWGVKAVTVLTRPHLEVLMPCLVVIASALLNINVMASASTWPCIFCLTSPTSRANLISHLVQVVFGWFYIVLESRNNQNVFMVCCTEFLYWHF